MGRRTAACSLSSLPAHASCLQAKRASDGALVLNTKWTALTGKPPCIMSGMTPTTSVNGLDLCAAAANGGYHGELAGGGLPLPEYARATVNKLVELQEPGVGE